VKSPLHLIFLCIRLGQRRIFSCVQHGLYSNDISLGRGGKKLTSVPSSAHPANQKMLARLESESGKSIYRLRKAIVKPVMGWVKEGLGFRQFSLRGHANVSGECDLVWL
jgi:hypothetical protein